MLRQKQQTGKITLLLLLIAIVFILKKYNNLSLKDAEKISVTNTEMQNDLIENDKVKEFEKF